MASEAPMRCQGLVLGAGAAGLAAARSLCEAGLEHVVVLEARQRAGGRCHTSDELGCGVPLDHGAQWIHGFSPEHPMVRLADDAGVATSPQADGLNMLALSDGSLPEAEEEQAAGFAFQRLTAAAGGAVLAVGGGDCTWTEALKSAAGSRDPADVLFGKRASPREMALLKLRVYFNYENYEGARLDRWSVRNGETVTCLSGGNAEVEGGYGSLVSGLAHGLDVRLGRRVVCVEYPDEDGAGADEVVVRCAVAGSEGQAEAEELYSAPRCVVALPLGVLRSGAVAFAPPLPARKAHAIANLGIALMDKVELLWEKRWWPAAVGTLQIASCESTLTFHPWPWFLEPKAARRHPLGWAVLVCYVTGAFAEELEGLEAEDLAGRCRAALSEAFPALCVPEPCAVHATRWGRDPCSLGSWTYLTAGCSLHDATALAEPVGNSGCLAFAGEHCCDGSQEGLDMGTVHGAFLSGCFAAQGLASRCSLAE